MKILMKRKIGLGVYPIQFKNCDFPGWEFHILFLFFDFVIIKRINAKWNYKENRLYNKNEFETSNAINKNNLIPLGYRNIYSTHKYETFGSDIYYIDKNNKKLPSFTLSCDYKRNEFLITYFHHQVYITRHVKNINEVKEFMNFFINRFKT
jgi:hypothetical protein